MLQITGEHQWQTRPLVGNVGGLKLLGVARIRGIPPTGGVQIPLDPAEQTPPPPRGGRSTRISTGQIGLLAVEPPGGMLRTLKLKLPSKKMK